MNRQQAIHVLGIEDDATPAQVKTAYRKLVLEHHPDKNSGDDTMFRRVTEAYHTLTQEDAPEGAEETTRTPTDEKTSSRAQWGAGPTDRPPEEDWSRYTSEFEEDRDWWQKYEAKFWHQYDMHIKGGDPTEKAREPDKQPRLRVNVDQSLCIGCCSCETIAPDVFELDRNVKSNPKSHVKNPTGSGVNLIMNAAETCPTKAIIVDDADTGQRMYPF